MKVLIVNAGSSSLKYQLVDMDNEQMIVKGQVERIAIEGSHLNQKTPDMSKVIDLYEPIPDHVVATKLMLRALLDPEKGVLKSVDEIGAVGHRVLHGGEEFTASCIITDEVKAAIRKFIPLGPLHNPANLMGIEACEEVMPHTPQVAVFDTAFHQTMPPKAFMYGVPYRYYKEMGVRRYGFLIEQLVRRNFNTKYRQSILGVLWSFLNPLLTMLVQYLVFSTLFRSAIDHFPVYLISGIIVFSFFTECVTLGMDAIVMNASLITKVAIPKLIFPFSRALSSLINFLISLLPLLLLMLLTGVRVSPALLLLPLMIAFLFLFALGVMLVMATLNVFFRDTRFLWSVISLLWTYATPIFYPDTIWPEGLRGIFHLNPMYQLIDFLRQIVIAGIPPTPERLLACGAGAFGMLMIGLVIFRRYEKKFVFHL